MVHLGTLFLNDFNAVPLQTSVEGSEVLTMLGTALANIHNQTFIQSIPMSDHIECPESDVSIENHHIRAFRGAITAHMFERHHVINVQVNVILPKNTENCILDCRTNNEVLNASKRTPIAKDTSLVIVPKPPFSTPVVEHGEYVCTKNAGFVPLRDQKAATHKMVNHPTPIA